jgi:hypothetical protein
MTGADKPFEGKHGLWDLITGPFQLQPMPTQGPLMSKIRVYLDIVKSKILRTVEPVYGKEKTARVLERWWNVRDASAAEVSKLFSLLDVN